MRKGRFGVVFAFYAILSFVLAVLNLPVLCGAVAAVAIFAEKDEWAGRQTLQAFFISIILTLCKFVFDVLDFITIIPIIGNVFNVLFVVVYSLIYAAALVLVILGVTRVCKEQDADIPILSDIAYGVYGHIKQSKFTQNPMGYPHQGQGQNLPPVNSNYTGQYQVPVNNPQPPHTDNSGAEDNRS